MRLQDVNVIVQIEGSPSTNRVNAYLNYGWRILTITQRGENSVNDGGTSHLIIVIIMGHIDRNAEHPKQDPYTKVWS